MAKTLHFVLRVLLAAALFSTYPAQADEALETGFRTPPGSARPWVYWFWIDGNISQQGITADLEAMKRAGIGGLLWMEVSGMAWAPDGKVKPLSPEWHEAMRWAIQECARLGLQFSVLASHASARR